MDTNDEHFLEVGAVEDPDPASLGQRLDCAPEIIVVEFFVRWPFERKDLRALRVQAAHYMLDGAIFTSGVHPLEDQERGPAILSIEPFLERDESLETSIEPAGRLSLVLERSRVGGIVAAQVDSFTGKNAKAIDIHLLGVEPGDGRLSLPRKARQGRRAFGEGSGQEGGWPPE